MAGQPLYTNLSGNPKDARVRMAPQATLSTITGGGAQVPIAATGSFTQGQVNGVGPQLTRGEIDDQVLHPSGKPLDGLAGKWQLGGGPLQFGTIDPGNPLQFMAFASAFGHYSFATPVGTGTGYLVNLLAGYAIGDTSIAVNTGAGTILAGDIIQFTGDTNKYIVVSTTGGGTVTNVVIAAPGLRQTLADDVALTVATYNVWRFGLSEATAVVPWLTMQWNDQVVTPRNLAGLIFHGFNTAAAPDSAYTLACPFGYHAFSEWGDSSQVAGAGSTLPRLIGTMDQNMDAEATDSDLYVMVVSAAAKTIKAKLGLGAGVSVGYATATQAVVPGTPLRLRDQYGARIGHPEDQVKFYVPASPTWTDGDVFKILRRRAPWSESLPTRRPISSVNIGLYVDGEEITIPGGVQTTNGWDAVYSQLDTPGSQGAIVQNDGSFVSTITPTRRITDLLFQKGIRTGAMVGVVIDAISKVLIGNTLRNYRVIIAYPRCLVTGPLHQTGAGGTDKNESPILIAKDPLTDLTFDGYTFSDPCTVLIESDVANISALAA